MVCKLGGRNILQRILAIAFALAMANTAHAADGTDLTRTYLNAYSDDCAFGAAHIKALRHYQVLMKRLRDPCPAYQLPRIHLGAILVAQASFELTVKTPDQWVQGHQDSIMEPAHLGPDKHLTVELFQDSESLLRGDRSDQLRRACAVRTLVDVLGSEPPSKLSASQLGNYRDACLQVDEPGSVLWLPRALRVSGSGLTDLVADRKRVFAVIGIASPPPPPPGEPDERWREALHTLIDAAVRNSSRGRGLQEDATS